MNEGKWGVVKSNAPFVTVWLYAVCAKCNRLRQNEGIFCEIVFVAVRGYCRRQFRKKQAMANFSKKPCHSSCQALKTLYYA